MATSPATLRMNDLARSTTPVSCGTMMNGPAENVSPGAISVALNSRCWRGCSMYPWRPSFRSSTDGL